MFEQRLIQRSFQDNYLKQSPREIREKHYIWQSPLLFPEDISDLEEFHQRSQHAGQLWLQNHDLRPFNVLILTHTNANISYVFQRSQTPNTSSVTVGPVSDCLLEQGEIFSPYELLFVELEQPLDLDIA